MVPVFNTEINTKTCLYKNYTILYCIVIKNVLGERKKSTCRSERNGCLLCTVDHQARNAPPSTECFSPQFLATFLGGFGATPVDQAGAPSESAHWNTSTLGQVDTFTTANTTHTPAVTMKKALYAWF